MKFLSCIKLTDDDGDDEHNTNNNNNNNDVNQRKKWHQSFNRLFKTSKTKRIIISDPTPLSREKIPEVTGVIQIGPKELNENNNDDDKANEIENEKINVETSKETIEDRIDERQLIDKNDLNNNLNNIKNDRTKNESITIKQNSNSETNDHYDDDNYYNYGWYWGNISRRDAENLLRGQNEGTFLVRKSSNQCFLYSLSFRSNGKTLHTRIEYSNGLYSFYSNDNQKFNNDHENDDNDDGNETLYDLISDAMNSNNADNIFFYSRGLQNKETSLHTITLLKPLSRYQYLNDFKYDNGMNHDNNNNNGNNTQQYRSLQYLCKFIIQHSKIAMNIFKHRQNQIPEKLIEFINDPHLFPYVGGNSNKKK